MENEDIIIIDEQKVQFGSVHSVREAEELVKEDYPSDDGWKCTHYEILKANDDGNTFNIELTMTRYYKRNLKR